MPQSLDIWIPSTQLSADSKPYTIYNINLKLPLRTYTIQKRFSDFLTLHSALSQISAPPVSPPPKSWFTRSTSSPGLTETRRKQLEQYLRTLNESSDSRWRESTAWRTFLNLPSTYTSKSATASTLHASVNNSTLDPSAWLETHADLKKQLHDARLYLTTRDQATTPKKQYEASANAKSALVRANALLTSLSTSLEQQSKSTTLGQGELRRRQDLLAAARKDHSALENLHNTITTKTKVDEVLASAQAHTNLLATTTPSQTRKGRVLGKETSETSTLDNTGLLQLQQQKLKEQDLDVDEIRKIVLRQKELSVAINQELEVQNDMLKLVDEDVDRVQGKINVAKRRIGKIK